MATNADKFMYSAPLWTGTVGAGGISDDTVTSFTLSSATGLTDGRAYVMTIDRVDANGVATPSKREVIIGVLSTSTMTNCLRGQEGAAQAHSAGAVIEILMTAKQWNRLIEGLVVEHGADGTHDNTKVALLAGTQTFTGAKTFTGVLPVAGTSSTSAEIRLAEDTDNGTNYMGIKAPSAVTASVTLTLPDGAGSNGQVLTTNGSDTLSWSDASGGLISTTKYAPEGFLINGKIVPSVASNNLTVAIKGMDGNDPSASNPVYVRIGDTVRTITSALSSTVNAGANYFNSGSAELATKEVDYFVYLGYSVTHSDMFIGFGRIPYATLLSDFVDSSTSEKLFSEFIGNLETTSASVVVNIGRFAATLSAGAGYTWSVPTFTATNLIQRPIYETRRLSYQPVYTPAGSMSYGTVTTNIAKYSIHYNKIFLSVFHTGTVGGTPGAYIGMTVPMAGSETAGFMSAGNACLTDNGSNQHTHLIWGDSVTLRAYKTSDSNYTAGSSTLRGSFEYAIA